MVDRSAVMAEALSRHRFTVDDYHRMVDASVLTEDDRVELLNGEFVLMAPIGAQHAECVDRLNDRFSPLRTVARVRIQNPVTLPPSAEPEPDLVLAQPRAQGYGARHPGPADILLIVEVAETSQVVDRDVKAPLYAEHGIREYWLIDLPAGRIEVFREPKGGAYASRRVALRGDLLTPLASPDFVVRVDDLLP